MAEEMDLFAVAAQSQGSTGSGSAARFAPLAQRMRPRNFNEFVGQQEAVGGGRFLRQMMEKDQISSMIFYGPPGCGKTATARYIASRTQAYTVELNAREKKLNRY